ncbi:MAG: hypothetical protein IPH08_16520 [Rhodocyclaceae bacterium]|nr:hypothetical protein [Rhodocyclaceae bacterium]MBK6908603.1 hypothetical protein [Rhodocyclaceae bacterium]
MPRTTDNSKHIALDLAGDVGSGQVAVLAALPSAIAFGATLSELQALRG